MDSQAATVAILAGSVLTWVSYVNPVIYRRYALPTVWGLIAIFLVIFTAQVMTERAARNALVYDPNMVSFGAFSTTATAIWSVKASVQKADCLSFERGITLMGDPPVGWLAKSSARKGHGHGMSSIAVSHHRRSSLVDVDFG